MSVRRLQSLVHPHDGASDVDEDRRRGQLVGIVEHAAQELREQMPDHRRDRDDDYGGYERAQPSVTHRRYDAVLEILHMGKAPFAG